MWSAIIDEVIDFCINLITVDLGLSRFNIYNDFIVDFNCDENAWQGYISFLNLHFNQLGIREIT